MFENFPDSVARIPNDSESLRTQARSFQGFIDQILIDDEAAPFKQRPCDEPPRAWMNDRLHPCAIFCQMLIGLLFSC
jgi:hypothetical protein